MKQKPEAIQRIYLVLLLFNTLAASFIWGINTLFLLDAGLSNTEAFAANAFFTLGQVIFEVPTGIIADTWGRRTSYLLGAITLSLATFLYYLAWQLHLPFWSWVITSVLLGLGFTFFSGATEAWLVDALTFTQFKGSMESVFAKGQIVGGIAMLVGSVSGGMVAQFTNLGVPYILRSLVLGVTFIIAFLWMKDIGFTPKRSKRLLKDVKEIFTTSINLGLKNPSLRWVMLEAPFSVGVSYYVFYAMQPYLLDLYGDQKAYGVAGLAAAIVAGAQIAGGLLVPYVKHVFRRRTSVLLAEVIIHGVLLLLLGVVTSFPVAIVIFIVWALLFAMRLPVRQTYLNGLIPTQERATVLSFDSLLGSSGGVVTQPILGKAADVWSYPLSYVGSAAFQFISVPLLLLARTKKSEAEVIERKDKS